jgi:predicted component of viral defense system (DUF524 family)
MALGTLSFHARARGTTAHDLPSALCIRGEIEWIVSGAAGEVAMLAEAVGAGHAERISEGALLLRFGNSVGRFAVGHLGLLVVQCGKWGEETFDALLSELTEVALALPYAADQSAGLPHDRTLVANNAILMHAFLYARQLILGPRETGLAASIAPILADPHRCFRIERDRVGLVDARRVDVRSMVRLARGAEPLERALGSTRGLALSQTLRGHLPTHVDVPRVLQSVDTSENRFVRAFLDQLGEIVQRVDRLARARTGGNPFWARVELECRDMRRALRPMRDHFLWEKVGRLAHVPAASSVLQRRRGYREVFRQHLLLRAAIRLPSDDTLSRLLGMKDVAALYELWCFFAVVRAVELVLGRPADTAERPHVDEVQMDVPWGLRVAWNDEVAIYYNLTFSQAHDDARRSASVQLRPDVVVSVRSGTTDTMHVLDAKLRIDRGKAGTLEVDASGNETSRSFKWSDIAKMHAYRDALPAVRTAFVLYPGNEAEQFALTGAEPGAVGAIPLVPGGTLDYLVEHLRSVVGMSKES